MNCNPCILQLSLRDTLLRYNCSVWTVIPVSLSCLSETLYCHSNVSNSSVWNVILVFLSYLSETLYCHITHNYIWSPLRDNPTRIYWKDSSKEQTYRLKCFLYNLKLSFEYHRERNKMADACFLCVNFN